MKHSDDDQNRNMVPFDDGIDGASQDEDADRIVKGTKLKYDDATGWIAGDEQIDPDREFLAFKFGKAIQQWVPGEVRPRTQMMPAEAKFPDVEAMNDAAPKSEWREWKGQKKGPYEAVVIIYFLDLSSMQIFTYINSTIGSKRAFHDLREAAKLARMIHGAAVYPVVTCGETPMPTKHGPRQRPHFIAKRFETLTASGASTAQLEHQCEGEAIAAEPKRRHDNDNERHRAKSRHDDDDNVKEETGEDEAAFELDGDADDAEDEATISKPARAARGALRASKAKLAGNKKR
jgi:hypothetical protein